MAKTSVLVFPPTKCFLLWIIALLIPAGVHAQTLGNLRVKSIVIEQDTTVLDLLSIAPGSVQLHNGQDSVAGSNYRIDPFNAYLIWLGTYPEDTLTVTYRTLPLNFTARQSNKDVSNIMPDDKGNYNPFEYSAGQGDPGFFTSSGLNKTGSISRGVAFGNNQDLSVNSNLNLQLSGKLNDRVNVLASITDDNIPIQPDGNTQQLQDFDQVYIQVFEDDWRLIAGDFQLRRPDSHFMTYFKKAQGGSFSKSFLLGTPNEFTKKPPLVLKTQLSAAASKGKFARNVIQGVEGNQGPYRLRGAENESFIIILSGTERVFIDGELLQRGQQNDYVIDYNTAEITFTPNRLITKDKRITVEFQYSDRNYARSLVQFSSALEHEKFNLTLNVYSEQDSRNQPLQQTLDPDDRELLSSVGDDLAAALAYGADSIEEFNNNEVLYAMIDTLGYDSVFLVSSSEDSAFYRVSFSNVGVGNGFYNRTTFTANGVAYEWVAPDTVNGVIMPQGEFEPIIVLFAPQQRQMVTLGGEYRFNKRNRAGFEVAVSNNDINTFSSLDAGDDIGLAVNTYVENRIPLQKGERPWTVVTNLNTEFVQDNFQAIERFRPVEFERNWNLPINVPIASDQLIAKGGVALDRKKLGRVAYAFDGLVLENDYTGLKHNFTTNLKDRGYQAIINGSYLTTDGANNTDFFRHKSDLSKQIRFLRIGFKDEHERNRFYQNTSDTLQVNSYEFYDWEFSLGTADTAKNSIGVFYRQRRDWSASTAENRLKKNALAEWYGLDFAMTKNRNSQLKGKVAYRTLNILDSLLTDQSPDNTLVSRLEYRARIWKGVVTSSTFYEIGTGLEQRREFVYLLVPAGQGIYAWIDYDGDNVKDLNEFEIAAFPDQAEYIRVFTPSNDYVKTFTNQFNQVLNLKPEVAWRNKTGWKKFAGRFSNQTALRIDRKTNNENLSTAYNPFLQEIADSTLLSLNSSLRNTVYFNRSNPKWGISHTYQDISGKTLLTSGFDSRSNSFNELDLRLNLTKKITWNIQLIEGTKTNSSDFLTGRNYNLDFREGEVRFTYQPSASFRVSLAGEYTEKFNSEDLGGESAIMRDVGTELRYNIVSKGSFLMNINYINVSYTGLTNTALAFEMLDGLNVGQNVTWSTSFQRNLSNNLQLSLNYLGRTSQTARTVHSGGVSVRAFF